MPEMKEYVIWQSKEAIAGREKQWDNNTYLVTKFPQTVIMNPSYNAWHKRRGSTTLDFTTDTDNLPILNQ
jgi:hypothetical protein